VVVGSRGPQLSHDGRVMLQLARARRLVQEGYPIAVVSEASWLDSIGFAAAAAGVRGLFTAGQLAETLGISRLAIDRWLDAGLLSPADERAGLPLFDFAQVAAARTLAELSAAGIRLVGIRRAMAQLARWLPATRPLADLALSASRRQIVARLPDGRLAEPSGQLVFDFGAGDEPPALPALRLTPHESYESRFRRALAHEQADELEAAVAIYRELLDERPHATLAFNLGNAQYAAGDAAGARASFHQATELDPQHSGAWNNLANILAEQDELEAAAAAYRRALAIDPGSADTRFNLAETLVELGRADEAFLHWQSFLALDAASTWADYARERMAQSR
jgi:tetratricopeptide (TPR) repeat protein